LAITAHFIPEGGKGCLDVMLEYVTLDRKSRADKLLFNIDNIRLWHDGDRWDEFELEEDTLFICPPDHPVADLVIRSAGNLYIVQVRVFLRIVS